MDQFVRQCGGGIAVSVLLPVPVDQALDLLSAALVRRRFASPATPAVVGSIKGSSLRLSASTGFGKPFVRAEVQPTVVGSSVTGQATWPGPLASVFVLFILIGFGIFVGSLVAAVRNLVTGAGAGSFPGVVGAGVFMLIWLGLLGFLSGRFAEQAATDVAYLCVWIGRVVEEDGPPLGR